MMNFFIIKPTGLSDDIVWFGCGRFLIALEQQQSQPKQEQEQEQ